MTAPIRIAISGRAVLGPSDELPMALDELIFAVVADALGDAQLSIGDIDGVCMSASDLNDGRAISTMTLTGSTGSLGKSEMRVCNDSLAAAWLGSAEIASGAADALIVCSWSKLSDATPDAIKPLALEPAFHRGLGFHPGAIVALRESHDGGVTTVMPPPRTKPVDAAVAMILTRVEPERPPDVSLIGFGSAMGPYLRPGEPLLGSLSAAADRACAQAAVGRDELRKVVVAGLQEVADERLCQALAVPEDRLERLAPRWADLGYAAGLLGVSRVLDVSDPGVSLVVSAGGIGLENAYGAVVQIR